MHTPSWGKNLQTNPAPWEFETSDSVPEYAAGSPGGQGFARHNLITSVVVPAVERLPEFER
jgi:hypothetical protein